MHFEYMSLFRSGKLFGWYHLYQILSDIAICIQYEEAVSAAPALQRRSPPPLATHRRDQGRAVVFTPPVWQPAARFSTVAADELHCSLLQAYYTLLQHLVVTARIPHLVEHGAVCGCTHARAEAQAGRVMSACSRLAIPRAQECCTGWVGGWCDEVLPRAPTVVQWY